tara:strand:+ start:19 stop:660 length:642 start_codon:yes stop_codon:yes gene_type:complete
MTDWRKQLLDDVEQRKKKNVVDTLKAKRTYADEVKKASPEYKETQRKKSETARINAETNLKKAKKEAKGPTPQEDILRYGQEQKKYRDLAYKERAVEEDTDDGGKTVSMQYIPRPGGEIFKQQAEAYGDSLKLAGMAQQYGTQTTTVRKIDRNREVINNEFNQNVENYMKETPDFSSASPENAQKLAEKKAVEDLIKKYGKGIIPLLSALKNR